jgi:hypothetical protein
MSLSATTKIFLFTLLPAFTFGQAVQITPAAPVAAVGTSITITADRPVTFHLSGAGSISVTTGLTTTYKAPATITAPHTLAGCMTTPSDSVFNTRIDNLPVNANSGSWTPFAMSNGVSFAAGWGINVVDQTTPVAAQQFADTPQLNGTPFPVLSPLVQKRENGSLTTDSTVDHHLVVLNQSTCQFYETNQSGISIAGCPTCTAQSGWTYSGTSYQQPAEASTDPAGLPLAPLTLHLSELKGTITHALRFTACAECIGTQAIWPAIASNGLQSGAPPLGTRFRLKASVDISSFPTAAYAVLTAMKRYGMILAGTGPTGQISVASDVAEDETTYQQLQTIAAANLSYTDFEVVDESSLQLAAGSYAVNPSNAYETPSNYATLTMTDQANPQNVVKVPIALQPVVIGTPDPTIVVQGGTATFQIPHWVTGTSNTATTWTISPATGAGTLTGDGYYTAPAVLTTAQSAIIQVVSAADKTATLRIYLNVIPSGGIRIDTGNFAGSQDTEGLTWTPDLGMEAGNFTAVVDTPSAWGTAVTATELSSYLYTDGGDIVYKLHVPNGSYQVGLSFGVGDCQGQYSSQIANQTSVWGALNLQSQNTLAYQNWSFSGAIASACRTPQTVNLPAQVTNGILTFGVRSASMNGARSAALLNAVSILPVNQPATNPTQAAGGNAPVTNLTYTPQQFDPSCGQPGYNCQSAFQIAFATLAQAGGGTLQVPAGTFTINFPGVIQNVIGGATLSRNNLIVVPPNTTIQGHVAADGTSDSIIEWQITSIPVFIFDRASNSGMHNLHLRFTGTTAAAYPFGDVAMLTALGYNPAFPHGNMMSGGNSDLFTFAFVFDSDNCTFDHLLFDSATQDNAHIYNMAINVKGKGVITTNGGGLTQLAESNRITNVQVNDFNNAFLICGQDNFLMQNVSADRRGSIASIAPGHLLYTSGTLQYDMSANMTGALLSTNMMLRNLIEGPDTYSNAVAGGTLSLKFLNGAQVSSIISQHPEGLIQTIYVDQNVTFSNMNWTSNYALCTNVPGNCSTPAIYTTASPSDLPATQNLTFQNITLVSTASPASVMLMGNNVQVRGMNITTLPNLLPGQTATSAILSLKQSTNAVITGYTYTPVLTSYTSGQQYNTPFTGWSPTSNVSAAVTIKWPKTVTRPTTGSIVTPIFQSSGGTYNNFVTTTFVGY